MCSCMGGAGRKGVWLGGRSLGDLVLLCRPGWGSCVKVSCGAGWGEVGATKGEGRGQAKIRPVNFTFRFVLLQKKNNGWRVLFGLCWQRDEAFVSAPHYHIERKQSRLALLRD